MILFGNYGTYKEEKDVNFKQLHCLFRVSNANWGIICVLLKTNWY